MAKSTAPSTASTLTHTEVLATHQGHKITKVGPVSVSQSKGGGTFTVWYCQDDDVLLMDIRS